MLTSLRCWYCINILERYEDVGRTLKLFDNLSFVFGTIIITADDLDRDGAQGILAQLPFNDVLKRFEMLSEDKRRQPNLLFLF